jgi:hypothetical protein
MAKTILKIVVKDDGTFTYKGNQIHGIKINGHYFVEKTPEKFIVRSIEIDNICDGGSK